MQTARIDKINKVFDEVARGTDLGVTLALIADLVAADLGAPTCKIWVVKRGDICDRCPLAGICANRQMCMHLAATSGASIDKEYPRIPLSVFNAEMIARGGTSDFSDPAGERLFGLQHGLQGEGRDSFALYPLKGAAGILGLIGVFNHRAIEAAELDSLANFAPAAVAVVRVAELRARCAVLHNQVDDQKAQVSAARGLAAGRERELQDAITQLTAHVSALQTHLDEVEAERDLFQRVSEEADRRAIGLEAENTTLMKRSDELASAHKESGRAYSEMAAKFESDRNRVESENSWLKGRVSTLERNLSEIGALRDALAGQLREREQALESAQVEIETSRAGFETRLAELDARDAGLDATRRELESLRQAVPRYEDRIARLDQENQGIRRKCSGLAETVDDLQRSLRDAEDKCAVLLQSRIALEESVGDLSRENEQLRGEARGIAGENEQLTGEADRLRIELGHIRSTAQRLGDESAALATARAETERLRQLAEARVAELEREKSELAHASAQLEQAERVKREAEARVAELELERSEFVQATIRLEDTERRRHLAEVRAAELGRENAELAQANTRLSEAQRSRELAEARVADLERENAELAQANAQLEEAVQQFETVAARLEESALKLRDRTEATERSRADVEQRNRVLSEQNRRLQKESHAKARFLANMSHELRTPMNAIIGFTSLLLEDAALHLSERHRRSLERVARNARDLLQLINNVLDLSKIDAGRMDVFAEPTDVRDVMERAIAVVEPLKQGRPIELVSEVQDGLPAMRTDRTKLQQILINLLSNAVKFTLDGEVRLSAERLGPDRIRIAVSDTGMGIADSDIAHIFEEFRQVSSANRRTAPGAGTGLGLPITRRLVELLGGKVSVTSHPGEGSVFAVMLPVEIEGRTAPAFDTSVGDGAAEHSALVVDSDPASLFVTKKYLSEAGYSVAATDDPARARELASTANPSVITIDIDLPEGGLNLIQELAGEAANAAADNAPTIIALSSAESPNSEAAARAIQAGAAAVIRKPIDRSDLLRVLKQATSPARRSVLAVDDDPDALDLVLALLEGSGYDVRTATNGREALAEIEKARPDVIILDLMLPEMDGFEVVHRLSLNPEWRNIPVILVTARDLSHEERRALDISTAQIIQKGNLSRDELLAGIGSVIGTGVASAGISALEHK
jgi:signal transduction histidine kinase/DNA-binding response OmpR family regulator